METQTDNQHDGKASGSGAVAPHNMCHSGNNATTASIDD